MLEFIFPPKCVLCRQLLTKEETDLCHNCRQRTPVFNRAKRNIPFVAQWTSLWYYKDDVRKSIHRFKFGNARSYADIYARHLAMQLQDMDIDILTWVPVSFLRRLKRGYDQAELFARALSKELNIPVRALLKKVRHTPPQSGLHNASQRRANVLGAYKVLHPNEVSGKRILLIDDVITTGATASECAKTLLSAHADKVYFASIAATDDNNK